MYWSAIWVGALAAIVSALIFGLAGTAVGATTAAAIDSWHTVPFVEVVFVVCGAFFSFAIGGWATAKVAGIRHAEPAVLHGTIAWLVAVPILVLLLAGGAGTGLGGWYGGLVTAHAADLAASSPVVVRNAALGALTALLVGLIGAVIGGWMGSGEPMSLTHRRTHERELVYSQKGF